MLGVKSWIFVTLKKHPNLLQYQLGQKGKNGNQNSMTSLYIDAPFSAKSYSKKQKQKNVTRMEKSKGGIIARGKWVKYDFKQALFFDWKTKSAWENKILTDFKIFMDF